eukprot:403349721
MSEDQELGANQLLAQQGGIPYDLKLTDQNDYRLYKQLKEDIVSGYNGGTKLEVYIICAFLPLAHMLHQVIITFFRQRNATFSKIRLNQHNSFAIQLVNMVVDYSITATPLILCCAIPEYNPQLYAGILSFIAMLVMIAHNDGKGKIMINIFREANPRGAFVIFENHRVINLFKKTKQQEEDSIKSANLKQELAKQSESKKNSNQQVNKDQNSQESLAKQVQSQTQLTQKQIASQEDAEKLTVHGEKIIYVNFISTYRSLIIIATALAILQIDFPMIYDRRFCKTEDYGVSLMDVGVGAVMFATGLSARKVRESLGLKKMSFLRDLYLTIKGNLIVTVAGSIRFFLLKDLNYQEHLTEWGAHWNFFATISVVNFALVFIRDIKHSLLISLVLMTGYEFALTSFGLKNYILYGPRNDIISANREGIFSTFGYLSLSLLGMTFGRQIFTSLAVTNNIKPNDQDDKKLELEEQRQKELGLIKRFSIFSVLIWLCMTLSEDVFEPASRRLCNMTYVLWQVLLLQSLTLYCFVVDRILIHHEGNVLIDVINYNQLLFFCAANLLTGLVNLKVKTIFQDFWTSLAYTFGYLLIVTFVFVLAKKAKFRAKF